MRRHWFGSRKWFRIFCAWFVPIFFLRNPAWTMTCDMVSYMNFYMDFYIILGHFFWHERFRTVHERFRTVQKSFECWNKSQLRIYCANILWCKNIGRLVVWKSRYFSVPCHWCTVRVSAHMYQVKSSVCVCVCFPLDCDCVTLSLLLSLPIFII